MEITGKGGEKGISVTCIKYDCLPKWNNLEFPSDYEQKTVKDYDNGLSEAIFGTCKNVFSKAPLPL